MSFPQMTTRRWVIAVAVVAITLGAIVVISRRRERFTLIALHHSRMVIGVIRVEKGTKSGVVYTYYSVGGIPITERMAARDRWTRELAAKYYRAAARPWLPVPPDPPEPK